MQPKMNSQCYEAEAALDFQVLVLHHESLRLVLLLLTTILETRVEFSEILLNLSYL